MKKIKPIIGWAITSNGKVVEIRLSREVARRWKQKLEGFGEESKILKVKITQVK